MQKTIISIVLTGLLASVVSGCDKKSDNRTEIENDLIENGVCYIKITKKEQIAQYGETMPTIHTLIAQAETIKSADKKKKLHTVLKQVIEQGCDVNETWQDMKPLAFVVTGNQRDLFTLLIENGADPMLTNQSSRNVQDKNLFEISAFLRLHDKSAERVKTDDLVQSYKAQFER